MSGACYMYKNSAYDGLDIKLESELGKGSKFSFAINLQAINDEHVDCKDISIYAMSANAFDEDVKCSLASGMNGHLSKPIDRVKLKEVLVKCLNK